MIFTKELLRFEKVLKGENIIVDPAFIRNLTLNLNCKMFFPKEEIIIRRHKALLLGIIYQGKIQIKGKA